MIDDLESKEQEIEDLTEEENAALHIVKGLKTNVPVIQFDKEAKEKQMQKKLQDLQLKFLEELFLLPFQLLIFFLADKHLLRPRLI